MSLYTDIRPGQRININGALISIHFIGDQWVTMRIISKDVPIVFPSGKRIGPEPVADADDFSGAVTPQGGEG